MAEHAGSIMLALRDSSNPQLELRMYLVRRTFYIVRVLHLRAFGT
jgi:hypothetical protein